ncbi:unnamed protein product [Amoebophrya sp. A25]|nr:unnamed protein product [Amoebophrya sp. A25]|eukprot:GSA25T00001671001.1
MPKAVANENVLPPGGASSPLRVSSLFNVAKKHVVVTGGGSGIGAMIAATFVENGAKVLICSRKDSSAYAKELSQRATATTTTTTTTTSSNRTNRTSSASASPSSSCSSSTAAQPCCTALADCDLGTEAGRQRVFVWCKEHFGGKVHVLVNNAGTNYAEMFENQRADLFAKVLHLNLTAVFLMTQKLLPMLEAAATGTAGGGDTGDAGVLAADEAALGENYSSVINITSINGLRNPEMETYSYQASKAGLNHLTTSMAMHLAPKKIRVNNVAPGAFPSRMMRGTIEMAGKELIAEKSAIPRLGMPGDVGAACIYLSSPASAWVTGTTLVVDGGNLVKARM